MLAMYIICFLFISQGKSAILFFSFWIATMSRTLWTGLDMVTVDVHCIRFNTNVMVLVPITIGASVFIFFVMVIIPLSSSNDSITHISE